MSAPLDPIAKRFAQLSLGILWVEAVARAFWPALTLVGAFAVVALLEIPAALPGLVHLVLLLAFTALLVAAIRQGFRRLRPPTADNALRRLEHDSGLRHRPFDALADRPAEDTPEARALWQLHQARKRREIGRLRLSPPRPDLAERDPRALRFAVLIALVLCLFVAGPRAGYLIGRALVPHFGGVAAVAAPPVDAWIKPPAYTGQAPILLRLGDDQTVTVPTGSTIEAHVTAGSRTPRLVVGDTRQDFAKIDGGGFSLSEKLSAGGKLSIRQGWSTLGQWKIAIVPDNPPTVDFTEAPVAMASGALKIGYRATDDYGVASVSIRMRLAPDQPPVAGEPIVGTLASDQTEKEVEGSSLQDFSANPWAGMKVLATLTARDAIGQEGDSAELALTLPERHFINPAAQAIAAARKHVILADQPRPETQIAVAVLAYQPDAYGNDFSVFLALKTAALELERPADDAEIEDLLWNAAVKIEDGARPEAEKALHDAEAALEKALKDPDTPDSEIARLTQNLKDAINRDLQALLANLKQRKEWGQPMPAIDEKTRIVNQKDLLDQLQQMAEMAQNGSRQAAQDMLDNLKSMLDNLSSAASGGEQNEKGQEVLRKLKDLAAKQRAMETDGSATAAEQQKALRQSLGDAARELDEAMGSIPSTVIGADRSMRDAEQSLKKGAPGSAKGQQEDAANNLDQAAQGLEQQLSEQQQGLSFQEGRGQENQDPLGRGTSPPQKNTGIKIPTARAMQRTREIRDELRRRAAEHDRSRMELDYIQRLLHQF
jgi:uncharacterized protein (TIGR02302 family)